MVRDDEGYVHFQECLTSLNRSWQIICKLEEGNVHPVLWTAAYHMALIDYAKPYKESRGANKRSHRLASPSSLSDSEMALHRQLLSLRDQFLAHSDLSLKEAKVYVGEVAGQPLPLIISNTDPVLPKLATVKQLIERVLDGLYRELPVYEQRFKSDET
jgi:hypothetical protein